MNDWLVVINRPVQAWWLGEGQSKSGNAMVPAEVGEVLCAIGLAVHTDDYPSRSRWWALPWDPEPW